MPKIEVDPIAEMLSREQALQSNAQPRNPPIEGQASDYEKSRPLDLPIEGKARDYELDRPRSLREHFSISANEMGDAADILEPQPRTMADHVRELSDQFYAHLNGHAAPFNMPPVHNPLAGLTEGRIVHYTTPDMHRAAIITKVWGPSGCVNLYVFPDGSYPLTNHTPTSILHQPAEANSLYTWHFIERVD